MAIVKKFYRDNDGIIKVLLTFDNGIEKILSIDQFDDEYAEHPELFLEISQSDINNMHELKNTNSSGEGIPPIVTIVLFIIVGFIISFWDQFVFFLMILPSILIFLEVIFTIYTLYNRINDKTPLNISNLKDGLIGAVTGFGIGVLLILMYLIPLSFLGKITLFNKMDTLNLFFYISIICTCIYAICKS